MHRVIDRRVCSNNLHGFIGIFVHHVDEEFHEHCQLPFYEQEILNDPITNNRLDYGNKANMTLSIC